MSSKIYFMNNDSKGLSWWLTRLVTSSILLLPESQRIKSGKRLLLKPVRRPVNVIPDAIKQESLATPEGNVMLYKTGKGPVIILSHGWSGAASQLFGLMKEISVMGYQAVAYDQLGHGQSDGNIANLFLFMKALRHVLDHVEERNEVEAIVTHSMGGDAALNILRRHYPLLMIAPSLDFINLLNQKIITSGVRQKLLTTILNDLERQHGFKIVESDPRDHLANYQGPVHIIHDKLDQFAPINNSEKAAIAHPHVTLTSTHGLGHGRIISASETLDAFQSLLKSSKP